MILQQKGRLGFLLFSLVLLVILEPWLMENTLLQAFLIIISTFAVISGVYAVSDNRRRVSIALVLAVPAVITTWLSPFVRQGPWGMVNLISLALFFGYTFVTVFEHVLRAREITKDEIYGAISVYILIGLVFGFIFTLLEMIQPGSFLAIHTGRPSFFYYSFVTLTTLGYGDIVPLSAFARSLSTVLAMSGVMYTAVLIGRLVGIASARKR